MNPLTIYLHAQNLRYMMNSALPKELELGHMHENLCISTLKESQSVLHCDTEGTCKLQERNVRRRKEIRSPSPGDDQHLFIFTPAAGWSNINHQHSLPALNPRKPLKGTASLEFI